MSEPVRLNRSKGLAGALLLSAKTDKAPAGVSRRLLAGAAVGAALTAKAGAAGSLSASVGSAVAHVVRWTSWKWLAIGLAGAGSVATVNAVLTARETARAHPSPVVVADVAPAVPARSTASRVASVPAPLPAPADVVPPVTPTHAAPLAASTANVVTAPAAAAPPRARELAPHAPSAASASLPAATATITSAPTSHLALEIAAIDAAKRTLAAGDGAGALAKVDAYDATFPRGMLAAEANALRIEALVRVGRRDDARAELGRFRTNHPDSPLLESLTRVVGD